MRLIPSPDHLTFYYRHHYIEFEDLLSEEEISVLLEKLPKDQMEGRDNWRKDGALKKIILRPNLAEVSAHLTKKESVRIGFDQLLVGGQSLYTSCAPLTELSCIRGVTCGLMLLLSDTPSDQLPSHLSTKDDVSMLTPIPHSRGSGIFFSSKVPLCLSPLSEVEGLLALMIVYAEEKSFYVEAPKDPLGYELKRLGLTYNERLSNAHPVIYRRH